MIALTFVTIPIIFTRKGFASLFVKLSYIPAGMYTVLKKQHRFPYRIHAVLCHHTIDFRQSGCLGNVLEFSTIGKRNDHRIRVPGFFDLFTIERKKLLPLLHHIILLYKALETFPIHVNRIHANVNQYFHSAFRT